MSKINYEFDGNLAVLTVAHAGPPVITSKTMDQLVTSVGKARADGCRALLLRAAGPVFFAGADISAFKGLSESAARTLFADYMKVMHAIESLDVPTVAAVQGFCIGGGLELALACDLIVAKRGTMFGQVEALLGAVTFLGGTQRLAQRCGTARALEITYTGSLYPAETFASWGIVSKVIHEDGFEAKALSFASSLATGPTAAHRVTKEVLRTARTAGMQEADARMLRLGATVMETKDLQTGVDVMLKMGSRAFMAHPRPVDFRGE